MLIVIPHQCCQCAIVSHVNLKKNKIWIHRFEKKEMNDTKKTAICLCVWKAHIHTLDDFFLSFFFSCYWLNQGMCARKSKKCLILFVPRVDSNKISPIPIPSFFSAIDVCSFRLHFFCMDMWRWSPSFHFYRVCVCVFLSRCSMRYIQTFSVKEHIYKVTRHERILPFFCHLPRICY